MLDPSISVAEIDHKKFEVYPNPASTLLTIAPQAGSEDFKVELFDMIGNKVKEAMSVASAKMNLDISNLAKGMYVLKTTVDGKSTSTRVSIAR